MDQSLINIILGSVSAALGWFARELWTAVKELKSDLARLREEIPKDYLSKDEYRIDLLRLENKIDNGFRELLARIDSKADKG